MSGKLVSIESGSLTRRADLVRELQRMLAEAEAGRLTDLVALTVEDGNFVVSRSGASLVDAVAYSTMMTDTFIRGLRR